MRQGETIKGLDNSRLDELFGYQAQELRDEIELVRGASHDFDLDAFLGGHLTPVFFGSAVNNFGVEDLLDALVEYAPAPQPCSTTTREVSPEEDKFSGFVFKIQANMDPAHHDRIAFLRICSGRYFKGMKVRHVRLGRDMAMNNATTFMAQDRDKVEEAYPGDIIGIYNHGTVQIGDTFTQGEDLKYTGIPHFAPELFRRARLRDPLRLKAAAKGSSAAVRGGGDPAVSPPVQQRSILGAIGPLQFDVVAQRLKNEYGVDCIFENVQASTPPAG